MPATVQRNTAPVGAAHSAQVTMQSRSLAQLTLKAARSDSPKIRAAPPEQREGRWVIPISVDTSELRPVEGKVTVTTDVLGEETLEIPVYAHIIAQE